MGREEQSQNLGDRIRSPFSPSGHPTSSISGEEDDENSHLQASQMAQPNPNAHRSSRLDVDWLRRRAITAAMRRNAAEATSEASMVDSTDRPAQADPATSGGIQAPTLSRGRDSMAEGASQDSLMLQGSSRQGDPSDVHEDGHLQGSSPFAHPSVEAQSPYDYSGSYHSSTGNSMSPSGRQSVPQPVGRHSLISSSPPATIGNTNNWLLPHPFGQETGLPVEGGSLYEGSQQTGSDFDIPSISSAASLSFNDRGQSSSASTPSSLRRATLEEQGGRSPYFPGSTAASNRSDFRTGSPFGRVGDARQLGPLTRSAATRSAQHSESSSVTGATRQASAHDALRRQHQLFYGRQEVGQDYASSSHLGGRRAALYDSGAGSSPSDYPARLQTQFMSPGPRQSPALESEDGYGPSVVSRAVTQTFTPNTSPYERQLVQMAARERNLGRADDIYHDSYAAGQHAEGWRQASPTPALHVPGNNRLRSPFQPNPQDSSILSSLGHLAAPQNTPRPARHLAESPMATRHAAETANPNVLNVDLSSDSESDDVDMEHRTTRRAPRTYVNEVNAEFTSDPTEGQDRVVCAISESRSADMIGVAVINVTTGQVDLIRIVNDDRYRRLTETLCRLPVPPQTFLVLKKIIDQQAKSALVAYLENDFSGTEVVAMDREHWNESNGLRMVDRFAWRKDIKAIRRNLEHNFYVSCAFSAVMAYVEEEMEVIFREHSLRIKHRQPADTMGLDRCTITTLELSQNVRNAKKSSSTLFGLLNNTLTPQGRRLIRSALLQPSTNKDEITARHEAVEELSSNEDLFKEVRASLKKVFHIDVERSIPWVAQNTAAQRLPLQEGLSLVHGRHQIAMPSHEALRGAEKDLNQVLMIKAYLGGIQAVRETLEAADCSNQVFKWVLEMCAQENLAPVVRLIEDSIEPDAIFSKAPIDIRNNRLWAFKAEPNSVLEGAREMYRERTNEMHQYVEELNKSFQEHLGTAPELRLANDNHYYLRFQWSDVERDLARQCAVTGSGSTASGVHRRAQLLGGVQIVNGIRRKQHYDCQTLELMQRSSQIQRHADIVTSQSDTFVVDLKSALLEHAEPLLAANDAIAMLDMLCSFAHLATTQNYVRPMVSGNLVLKGARHPVMEVRRQDFVANDVYSGDQGARFQVVTGGNMSGKSTFIKTVALIQIMAQIGSFVPATYAAVPICDRLFTRLSTEDKPESNLGTFAVEMTEMNMILRQVTKDSLVIIDELGRGTSSKEGLAIALSMSEELIKKECRVFFATHFTELARVLNSTNPNSVLNVHVVGESTKSGDTAQITLPHTIAPGPVKNEDYGLDLARRFLPEHVVKNAEAVAKFLRDKNTGNATGPATKAAKQDKLVRALPDLLKQAHDSTMDDSALSSYVKKLQTEFTIRMDMDADDNTQEFEAGESAKVPIARPVLEKPSEEELEEWKKKCDAAERRVMHANTAHLLEKKRPAESTADGKQEYPHKRDRTGDGDTRSMVSQPTPINRGAMIEALRRGACTPTTRAETPSSFRSEGVNSSMADAVRVVGQEDTAMEDVTPGTDVHIQRVVSISSGSSNYDDVEMPDVGDGEAASLPAASERAVSADAYSEMEQPLAQFQPLREWYARESQAAGQESGEGGSASGNLLRSRSGTQEFMPGMDEDEEAEEWSG